jgi:uncharacterized protein involved in exopolysaccharide biosynthesis/Mrp family chromosome partitioning ATPase
MPAPLPPSSPSITVGDIYYILFRHKWRILICSTLGVLAAAAIHEFRPPPYQSEAKLFIRYVVTDSQLPGPPGDDVRTKSPDRGGETIMGSELQILTSVDLAMQVAKTIGPEKILAKSGGGNSLNRAASVINQGLVVDVAPRSSVIDLKFSNADPLIVQPVLQEIIASYLKMHVEIHRAVGIIGDFLTQETDQLRSRLAQTEDDLRRAKNKAGVISLDDTKKAYADQMSRIQQQIFDAQADLAQRTAIFQALTKTSPTPTTTPDEPPLPPDVVDQYQAISSRIDLLRKTQQQMLTQFTPENTRVKDVRAQLDAAEVTRKELLTKYPRLAQTAPASAGSQPAGFDVAAEAIRLTALQSRIKVLNAQMDQIRAEASTVNKSEDSIMELQRKKDLEESNYRYYSASLEQSRINEALGAGKVSNISPIQTPSPPSKDMKKTFQFMMGAVGGGIAAGLAWAFLIELFLDHSVRRPIDVERMLGVPLFLSIPVLRSGRNRRQLNAGFGSAPALNAPKAANGAVVPAAAGGMMLAEMEHAHVLHTFHETLRDRLIGYFESRNLTHKPKLVAVTGLGRGSGVTTTAAGLASCLSETGEGNVLLVDMTAGQGSAQQFYRGKEVVGLEELFATRDHAQVQDKLFVVSEEPGQDRLSRILPQRFTKLVPQLKASNFDYIIFDMPPVSQISITPRLAGFMDMVLMVIESEKTDRELVQRATALLAQSKAHVGAVLNKTRTYVPPKLHQEYLGNI